MSIVSQFRARRRTRRSILGFTLLELLVVIAIIGILISMGAVAFSTAQRKGRDSKRRADIKVMQSAFEQYFADNTEYDSSSATCGTMMSDTTYLPGGAPSDPQGINPYTCRSTGTAYCVCASLEDTGIGNATDDASSATCSYGSGGDYYCLSNLQ